MSMLWQRFGRCARDLSLRGTAILVVEKEYINHLKNVKKKWKWNTSSIKTEPRASSTVKQPQTELMEQSIGADEYPCSENELSESNEIDAGGEDDEQEPVDDEEEGSTPKMKKGKSKRSKIDPEILDLINAETRGIGCRQQPFLQKFNNSKSSTLFIFTTIIS